MADTQLGFDFTVPPPATVEREAPASIPADVPALVRSLADAADADAVSRKLLIGTTRGEVKELLRQLARHRGGWIGFEATTVRPLAVEIAGPRLAAEGVGLLDAFDEQAVIDQAIDGALKDRQPDRFSDLAEGFGFRKAVASAVAGLRLAGVDADRLARSELADREKRRVLASILGRYERALARTKQVDTAGLVSTAIQVLEPASDLGEVLGECRVYLLPGLSRRGLVGSLLDALVRHGARVLRADPVHGLDPPESITWLQGDRSGPFSGLHAAPTGKPTGDLEIFAAAGITAELREVLRRVVSAGLPWDQVEIATPDAPVYGSALHALAERLDVPVTFGVGLSVDRTRPGRVTAAYFRWIEGGFQADVIRWLLEAGDLRPHVHAGVLPMDLARRFRDLRLGWGRQRYLETLSRRLRDAPRLRPGRYESEAAAARRRATVVRELEALDSIVRPVLERTPLVPPPTEGRGGPPVSPAELAAGLSVFLECVPVEDAVDDTALARLQRVLARIGATLHRKTEYAWAAAVLKSHLSFRVPAPRAEGKAPWSSAGGHLYLTDLEHAGASGRSHTFIVGMDSSRFPGGGLEDPLLLDTDRRRVADRALPTASERIAERRFRFAALLARLRGQVTVSYCVWSPAEARALTPSAEVLQAFRLARGRAAATFDDLRTYTTPVAASIPAGVESLDAQDVWMAAMAHGALLLDGVAAVRGAHPHVDAGLTARAALEGDRATAHHGLLEPRPELDPRDNPGRVVSASGLERLGACPKRYFYQHVLRIRLPDEPRYDPDVWLDPLAKGSVLHRVYERTLAKAREQQVEAESEDFIALALGVLTREIERASIDHPWPSRQVRDRQIADLRADVRSFATLVHTTAADWVGLEVRFGLGDQPTLSLPVEGGTILVRGAIDRIDETAEGLVVVDYKTGGPSRYGTSRGVFDRGRRLQHLIYTLAALRLYDQPVVRMEYQFPTRRAENRVIPFEVEQLRLGPEVVGKLLNNVRAGRFMATDDPSDCRFCDYASVCRVVVGGWGKVESPPAEWVRGNDDDPAIRDLKATWRVEDEGFPLIPPPPLADLVRGHDV